MSAATDPSSTELAELIALLEARIPDARSGLPSEVFYFVTRLTPMVNVELLIRNEQGQTLLTWRADQFYGPGWHIPGGIIRFKESAASRIAAVAHSELGATVAAEATPLKVTEVMATHRDVRGHFIGLLFNCRLTSEPDAARAFRGDTPGNGNWCWFDRCPRDLIRVHEIYRPFIDGSR